MGRRDCIIFLSKYSYVLIVLLCLVSNVTIASNISESVSFIYGGSEVKEFEYTPVVALTKSNGSFYCSGVLIGKNVVLTAGHCVRETFSSDQAFKDETTIHVGSGSTEKYTGEYSVKQVIVHPDYRKSTTDWKDFAVLILNKETKVPLSHVFEPLQDPGEVEEVFVNNQDAVIVGFGVTPDGTKGLKLKANVKIREIRKGEFKAGNSTSSACFGDSGGPVFVTLSSGAVRLVGITSRGKETCKDGAIYGRIDDALTWAELKLIYSAVSGAAKAEQIVNSGITALKEKNYDHAISEFHKAYDMSRYDIKYYAYLGLAYSKRGYENYIKQVYSKARSDYINAFYYRGYGWFMKNEFRNAIEDMTTIIEIDDAYKKAYEVRANAYEMLGEIDNALEDRAKLKELGGV